MDPLDYFAGQALPVLLHAHLSGELPVANGNGSSMDLERAAWRIAQNMIATRPVSA